jgi:Trk K+ transport system NAD-binding subunit
VLARLLSHSLSDAFQTAVLMRSSEKAKQFRTLGVKAVVGSNSDHDLLRQLAGEADIVFACVSSEFIRYMTLC